MYRTKTREKTEPLEANTCELVKISDNLSTVMNDSYLPVLTREERTTVS